MDVKELFGLTVVPAAFLGGIVLACLSTRVRDLFFILLVTLAPLIERLDVNYVSREWYRGTSRGFEIAVLDIFSLALLVSSILFPRRGQARAYWPASLGVMLLYFLYAFGNVIISDPRLFGWFELWRMFRGLVLVLAVALYLRSERELRLLIFSVAVLLGFQALLAIKQRYMDGLHRVPGTLIESNSLSGLLCTVTPFMVTALTSRLPRSLKLMCAATIPLAMVAEILTISRAGVTVMGLMLFGAAVTTMSFRLTPRRIILCVVIILGVTGLVAKSWKTLGERFNESTLKDEYGNKRNMGRGYYLRIAMAIGRDRFFGVGLNNWSYWVSNKYGPQEGYRFVPYRGTDHEPSNILPSTSNVDMPQAAPAHNLGALTMGELGLPGLFLFSLVWARWLQMGASFIGKRDPDPMLRMGVGLFFCISGVFLHCLTEWLFRHVPVYYVCHILVGALIALYHHKQMARRAASPHEPLAEKREVPALPLMAELPVRI